MSGLTVVITEPPALNLNIISTDALCAIIRIRWNSKVLATGERWGIPYAWTWGGSTGNILNGVPAGNYTVTVHDANGLVQKCYSGCLWTTCIVTSWLTTQNNVQLRADRMVQLLCRHLFTPFVSICMVTDRWNIFSYRDECGILRATVTGWEFLSDFTMPFKLLNPLRCRLHRQLRTSHVTEEIPVHFH